MLTQERKTASAPGLVAEAGVEHEDRVPVGEIADRAGDCLWMDAIGAAREISLLVELAVPGTALLREPVPVARVGFRRDLNNHKRLLDRKRPIQVRIRFPSG